MNVKRIVINDNRETEKFCELRESPEMPDYYELVERYEPHNIRLFRKEMITCIDPSDDYYENTNRDS